MLDEDGPPSESERRALLDDLDRVFTALQAHSYPGDYLLENDSLDRRAETVMKLEEDLLGACRYETDRVARITAGGPMNVSAMIREGQLTAKGGAGALTGLLEERLAAMLRDV
jgi:hypothetical protein